MTRNILINSSIGETRMALTQNDVVSEIRLFRDHSPSYVGAIYLGRVTKLSSEFQAAFVELDKNLHGFLPLKSLPKSLNNTRGKKPKDLTTLLHEGQRLTVQVTADAEAGKSLKLTARPELVSPAIVLHPFREGAYVSSRIKDPQRRAELKEFGQSLDLGTLGLTFRTEAEHVARAQLKATVDKLVSHWKQVSKTSKCPALLTQGPEPIAQIMREYSGSGLGAIIVDQASALKTARDWARSFAPDLLDKITLHKEKISLFSHYEVDDQIEQIEDAHVSLNSGAWITIEKTEALTVIDVNMGDAQFSSDRDKQIFTLNREAAREIFRQLRLRGIGGIIVIDFIDMANKGEIKSLLHFIDELMAQDPLPVQRGNISSFGLLELTRKSKGQDLASLLLGRRTLSKNVASRALEHIRGAEKQALEKPGQPVLIKVDKKIKKWLEKNSEIFDKFLKRTGSNLTMELI